MKEIIVCKLNADKKRIALMTEIAKILNELFTQTRVSLARKIHTPSKPFESFFKICQHHLTWNISYLSELKDAF